MSFQIIIVLILTLAIHSISTLAYSVRVVGIRTGRITVSFALFNILVLFARTSNAVQAPLLAKQVEQDIASSVSMNLSIPFRLILLSATIGTAFGILFFPTFQRLLTKTVQAFTLQRSIPRLIFHGFSRSGFRHIKDSITIPSARDMKDIARKHRMPIHILIMNILAVSLLTVGVLSSLYAGYIIPGLRVTCSNLAPVINGLATVILVIFVDPYLSMMTDDVIQGDVTETFFRRSVILMVISRLFGTVLAQLFFVPASKIISYIANLL